MWNAMLHGLAAGTELRVAGSATVSVNGDDGDE
jgi:hypothetical protein